MLRRSPVLRFRTAALLLVALGVAAPVVAQRPFRVYDPFYRGESARRPFYDGYAITGEVSYRASGELQGGETSIEPNPLGLALRLDYELTPNLDLGAVVDASGASRSLSWSWVTLKYFWTVDQSDYAFRLALDPDSDGRVGFPQADFAFLASSILSPLLSSDFAVGARRVRRGYQQLVPIEQAPEVEAPLPPASPRTHALYHNRALGWEVHLMMNYNLHLSPSGTKFYTTLLADRGQYELHRQAVEAVAAPVRQMASTSATGAGGGSDTAAAPESYLGGVVWVRPGFEYARPGYRVTPFVNIPIAQWTPEGHYRARTHVGVQLMLR